MDVVIRFGIRSAMQNTSVRGGQPVDTTPTHLELRYVPIARFEMNVRAWDLVSTGMVWIHIRRYVGPDVE